MYKDALELFPSDPSLNLILATLCPPHHRSSSSIRSRYEKIVNSLHHLLSVVSHNSVRMDPTRELGQMPLGWPYMGYSLRPLNELLGRTYALFFPVLLETSLPADAAGEGSNHQDDDDDDDDDVHLLLPDDFNGSRRSRRRRSRRRRVRFGIVAESLGNTSPGMLISSALEFVAADSSNFEVVLFKPPGLDTDFSRTIEAVAFDVVTLPLFDVTASQGIVKDAKCDFLLYMALGMSPLTYYLSFGRLAKVQAVYGHGHPITSGLPSIDYFISSDLFQLGYRGGDRECDNDKYGKYARTPAEELTASDIRDAALELKQLEGLGGHVGFTEQLVLFDSSTSHFPPPSLTPHERNLTLSDFGLGFDGAYNYYACLQYSKKLHPAFDDALIGILKGDPRGKILLLDGARAIFDRMKRSGSFEGDMLKRVVFVRRMERGDLIALLSLCDAFLGTYPWGEGVTSLEALSVNLPVVLLPGKITVEQLALGQLRAIGIESKLSARNVSDYVDIAVRIGTDEKWRRGIKEHIERNKWKLFGERQLENVGNEWKEFIFNAVTNAE